MVAMVDIVVHFLRRFMKRFSFRVTIFSFFFHSVERFRFVGFFGHAWCIFVYISWSWQCLFHNRAAQLVVSFWCAPSNAWTFRLPILMGSIAAREKFDPCRGLLRCKRFPGCPGQNCSLFGVEIYGCMGYIALQYIWHYGTYGIYGHMYIYVSHTMTPYILIHIKTWGCQLWCHVIDKVSK